MSFNLLTKSYCDWFVADHHQFAWHKSWSLVYLREQRHVGAARCSRVGQDQDKTGQLGTSRRGQASLGVKHLLAGVHSVRSRPQQSLKHTRRWGRRGAAGERTRTSCKSDSAWTVGRPSYKLKRMWLTLAARQWEDDEIKTNEEYSRIQLCPSPEVIVLIFP